MDLDQEERLNVLIPEEYNVEDYKYYNLIDYIILNVSDGGRIVCLDDSNFLSLSSIDDGVVISCFRYDNWDNHELYACDLIHGSDIIIDYEYEKVMFLMPDKFYIDNPDGDMVLFFLKEF